MDLNKLFETQAKLDNRIVEEKRLHDVDLLDKKILALQVELGELANELPEVFKFWSDKKSDYERALEEYVDCLHFILSIGNELEQTITVVDLTLKGTNITKHFNHLINAVSGIRSEFHDVFMMFFGLGEILGFTTSQIEQAYYDKNKINHERQGNGY